MPLTTLSTLLVCLMMTGSWFYIGQRISKGTGRVSPQVHFLRSFFLYFGIFGLIIFLPHLLLTIKPTLFPLSMGWGYVIGHVFLYIAFINALRLTFSLVPRLAPKEKYAIALSILAILLITAVNIKTMIFGVLPAYDMAKHVTLLNASPIVGAAIGIFATVAMLPAATLMILNGLHNPSARLRSFLLGGGLYVIMTAGPLHDLARNWQLYTVADIMLIIGLIIMTAGVLYRLEERIAQPVSAAITRR